MFLSESPYWSRPPRDGYWGTHKRLAINVISDASDLVSRLCTTISWDAGSELRNALKVIEEGITRLPVLEGEISHIEIPRLSANLGVTIVGGADTALRCVVVQEVFADGLVASDGRLRPGDQIIEINGTDTTSASHHQVCQLLRKMTPVLRLGVYRERIEAYHSRNSAHYVEEIRTIVLERSHKQQLGVRLSGWWMEPGIYVLEVIEGSPAAKSGYFEPYDRIISINGEDVQKERLERASYLIQSSETVTIVIARKKFNKDSQGGNLHCLNNGNVDPQQVNITVHNIDGAAAPENNNNAHLQVWNFSPSQSWQSKLQQIPPDLNMNTTTNSFEDTKNVECEEALEQMSLSNQQNKPNKKSRGLSRNKWSFEPATEIPYKFSRNNMLECVLLQQKTVAITKDPNESLGMRIGGGLGSNEGDIPIYIANIHPQGCVGQTQQVWKGDILLSVNGTSLLGLTHAQAVATLKATVESSVVNVGLLEGPETSIGANNFIPSWLYWQKLPRCLQFPKIVILNRSPGASLGFSIVGGEDPVRGPEPIHVLFVVQESPAARDGKLKCGDRLLAVDGHSLENVKHATAVAMLKQTGVRVTLEVVSWLGTEL